MAQRTVAKHRITVETMPKTGRRVDPPRSRWTCSCGAGSEGKLMLPAEAHRQADRHVELGKTAAPQKPAAPRRKWRRVR